MKNLLLIAAVIAVFTACTSNAGNTKDKTMPADKTSIQNSSAQSDQPVYTESNPEYVNTTPTAVAPKDKKVSDAAKGAIIGGASGAVVGAVASKGQLKGTAIGAAVGAGTGYVIGRSRDKKSGRVERRRAIRRAQ